MALWGRLDTLAASPKYITRKAYFGTAAVNTTDNTIDLRNSNTDFATGDGVVYNANGGTALTGLTSGNTYYAYQTAVSGVFKLSDTEAHAKAGTDFIDLSGTGNAAQFLQRNAEGNEGYDHTNNGMDLYFIDADEAAQPENRARGLKNPGWWLYRSWTNEDGSVQHRAECLVAMTSYSGATGFGTYQAQTGDASDDTVLVDATVTITAQPAATATAVAGAAIATLASVTATITGAGTLTYQWQHSTNGGTSYSNINPAGGVFTGADTATLGVNSGMTDTSSTWNAAKFRCVVGASTGNTDKTSTALTLTVTP